MFNQVLFFTSFEFLINLEDFVPTKKKKKKELEDKKHK